MHARGCQCLMSLTCIEDIGIIVPSARPVALMHKHTNQLVGDALPAIREGRGRGQVGAVRAQKGRQVEAGLEGHVACKLDEVWSEALEVKGEGVGGCVDVQGLVGCLITTSHNDTFNLTCSTDERGYASTCGLSSCSTHNANSDTTCLTGNLGCARTCGLSELCHSQSYP